MTPFERLEDFLDRLDDKAKAKLCGEIMSTVDPTRDVLHVFINHVDEDVRGELACRMYDSELS